MLHKKIAPRPSSATNLKRLRDRRNEVSSLPSHRRAGGVGGCPRAAIVIEQLWHNSSPFRAFSLMGSFAASTGIASNNLDEVGGPQPPSTGGNTPVRRATNG